MAILGHGLTTSWSWELKDWPNQVITLSALAAVLIYARVAGRTPLECLNYRLDTWVVTIVKGGFVKRVSTEEQAPRILGMRRGLLIRVLIYATLAVVVTLIVIPVSSELF